MFVCGCVRAHVRVCVCLQVLADAVSRLVVDKFSELTDNFTSPHARRKVLAGVVMTTGNIRGEQGFYYMPISVIQEETYSIEPGKKVLELQCFLVYPRSYVLKITSDW